jgi:hypothetical protein
MFKGLGYKGRGAERRIAEHLNYQKITFLKL